MHGDLFRCRRIFIVRLRESFEKVRSKSDDVCWNDPGYRVVPRLLALAARKANASDRLRTVRAGRVC